MGKTLTKEERYNRKKTASQTDRSKKTTSSVRNSHYNSSTYKKNNPKVEEKVETKVEPKIERKVESKVDTNKYERKKPTTSVERNSHYDSSKTYDKINETVKKEPLQLDQEAFNTWMDTATGRQGTQRTKEEPGDQKLMKMAGNIVGGMVNTGFKGYDLLKEFASEQMIKGYESNRENLLGAGYTNEQIDELIQKERDKFDINDEDNWSNLIDKQIEQNRQDIYDDASGLEKFALQTVEGAGQFGAHMLLAMATGGSSLVTMGLQAGTEKAHQNLQEGYDVNTAIGNGAMTGIMTSLIEKLPVDNFGKLVTSPLAQFSLTAIASQAISEGAEEGLEYLIEPQIDKFMLGKEVEYSMGELFISVALGMSSGGLIGTVGNAVPIIKTRKQFNQLKADMDTLIEYKNTNQLTEQETIAVDGALTLAQKALNKFESTSVLKNAVQYESDKVNKLSAREIQENFTKFLQPQMDQDVKLNQEQQAVNSILENSQKVLAQKGIQMDALQYSKLDNKAKAEVDKIQSFANSLNTNVVFNSDLVTENGQVIDGMHIPGVGIVINPNGKRKAMSTFVHELTHGTESSQYYAPLKKLLIDADSKYMEKVKNIRSAYKTVADLSLEDATKEYVAIETQDKLGNEQFVEGLVKYNTSLANRIYEGIKQIVSLTNTEQDIEYNFLKAFRNSGIDASQTQYSVGLTQDSLGRSLSKEQKDYFKNTKAVDEDGNLKVLYHGSTSSPFYEFDRTKSVIESDWGKGFYASDSYDDVSNNYEGGGPDYESKVSRLAEQIESEEGIDYEEAEERARETLGKDEYLIEAYGKFDNPAIVGETYILAFEDYADNYDIDDFDNEDDYYESVNEIIYDTIDDAMKEVYDGIDLYNYDSYEDIKGELYSAMSEGGVEIGDLKERINNLYLETDEGLAGNEITRLILKGLGYDGIIDNTVSRKFRNMGLEADTTHYIAFESSQYKNIDNTKPTSNPDIRYSIGLSAKEIRNNHKQYKEVNDNFISAFGRIINKKDMDADYKELLSSTVLEKIKTGKVSYDKMETLKSETWNRLYDYEANPEYETYKTIRDTIRNKKISMKSLGFDDRRFKEHKRGIGDFAGMKDWNEFRTKHKGTFTFVKDGGTDIDDIYTDLVRNYPGLLEDEDANGAYDKLMEITNYLDNKQDEYFKVHQSEQGVTYEMFEEDFNNKIENMMNEIDTKKEISLLMSKNNIRKNPDNAILSAGAIIPNHDIIRQKYPEFSELNFNKAMLEQLSTGKVTDDTVKALKEDLIKNVYGNDATKENPASKQVDEFLNDSIQYFLTNAKYESNKEYMDSIASQAINAMKGYTSLNREKIESTYDKVEAKEIAKEAIKDKNIKRRISVAQAVDNLVFNGSNKRMSMFRTLDQNLDVVANGNVDLRNDLRDTLEMKRFEAQNRYKEIIEKYCAINDKIVKELGIKGKSKESKGMQWFMELHKEDGSPYSQQQLLLDFDYTMPNGKKAYENIMEAAKLQSDAYNELFKAINEGREDIYGDIDINNELQTKELEAKYNQAKHTMIQIRDELKNHPSDKLEAAYEQAREEVRKLYKQLQSKIERDENGDSTRRQKLPYRKNYAHHLVEKGFMESLVGKVDGSAVKEVPTYLAGISDDAEPKTGYAKFFSKQTGGSYRADAVEGFAEYIVEAARIIAYDPYIDYVRGFANDIRAVAQDDNMSQFTRYLTDYANDIAGKTGKIDRAVRDLVGDKAFGVLKTLNSRVKANAILGNIRTATTQIFNIPNALGVLVDNGGAGTTQDVMKGAASYMNSILTNKNDDSDASPFIAARYLDVNTQSKGIAAKLENISKFMLSKGDEISTKMIWNAAYQQALRTNQENPVFYADDLTRRAVAGRGVGEVPLALQSQFMNLMIPFQVETNNAFKTLTSKVKDKKAASVLTILLANWIFNAISESLYGDRLLFDPIDVIADAIKDYKEDEEKDEVKSIANTINRLFGETLSSIPGGAYVPMVLGMDDDTTERIFGDNDPSRYGTGNIGLSVFGNAYKDIMQGNLLDAASDLAANFALPGGGKQLQRTIEALQTNGMLPQYENGQLVQEPIYYTGSGKVGYVTNPDAIMDSPENFFDFAKQVMFGKWAGKEAQEYIEGGFKSMGKTQTNMFDALNEGMNTSDSYNMAEEVYEAKKNMTGEDGKLQFIEYLNSGEFTPEQRNEIYDTYYGDSAVTVRINEFAKGANLDADQTFKVKDILSTTVSLKDSNDNTIDHSKALSIRKQLDELGLYDDLINYMNDYNSKVEKESDKLQFGDFGLNKTVGPLSNIDFQQMYKEIYGESYEAQTDNSLYDAYASTFGKSSGKGSTTNKTSNKTTSSKKESTSNKETASTSNDVFSMEEQKAKIDSILAKVYGGTSSTTSAYNKINNILKKVQSSKTKSTINIKSKYSKLIKDYLKNHPEDAHLFS